MDTIVRLPDPATVAESLRDIAAVQKLQKALGQAYQALNDNGRQAVTTQFQKKFPSATVAGALQKATAVTPKEKDQLVCLTEAISQNSLHPELKTHPGFAEPLRSLDQVEAVIVAGAVKKVLAFVLEIDTGKYDQQIINVFGLAVVDEVKKRFKLSLEALLRIHSAGKIVVDTVQKEAVWSCGGLTSVSQIALPDKLKTVSEVQLMTTLVHEMTHAMPDENTRTGDKYYRHHDRFSRVGEQRKLMTADYYAEVFDRAQKKIPGEVYVPTKNTEMSGQPGALLKQYRDAAQKLVNLAWAMAINMHSTLALVGKAAQAGESSRFTPNWASTVVHPPEHIDCLRNMSRVLGLTIHKRQDLRGTMNQVTSLDLSIVDNKLNVLGRLQASLGKALTVPATIKSFEERRVDELLKMALKIENGGKERPGMLSRDIDKDIIVIRSLAKLNDAPLWKEWIGKLTKELPEPMKSYKNGDVH